MTNKLLNISKQLLIVKTPDELELLLNQLFELLNLSWDDYQKGVDTFGKVEIMTVENELNRYNSAEELIVYLFNSSIRLLNEHSFNQKYDPFNNENKIVIFAAVYMIRKIVEWLDVNYDVKDFNIYYE